tara:strand:- start:1696 stop:2301 length:606 start_codon:yes stop_codon:yes gene_type:complete
MAENLVSQPPLNTPIVDKNGLPSRVFSIWMRDIYKRIAFKGGNAIDENANITDGVVDTLEEVIVVVDDQEERITKNTDDISINNLAINENASNLEEHELLETAHGSNGDIIGLDDLAEEAIQGLVKRMALIADGVASSANVVQADASAAPAAYLQAHSQELVDLSNANKVAINLLVTDFNNAVTVLNTLIDNSKTSNQMTS